MDYSILGPVSVRPTPDSEPIKLSEKPRLLIARLLSEPRAAIAASVLVRDIWGPGADLADPANSLQRVVVQLRQALGDVAEPRTTIVLTGTQSYRLVADPLRIDAERFKLLARHGGSLARRNPRVAAAMLEDALASWHGSPFADLSQHDWTEPHAVELEVIRNSAQL